jgi:hypothetical protein
MQIVSSFKNWHLVTCWWLDREGHARSCGIKSRWSRIILIFLSVFHLFYLFFRWDFDFTSIKKSIFVLSLMIWNLKIKSKSVVIINNNDAFKKPRSYKIQWCHLAGWYNGAKIHGPTIAGNCCGLALPLVKKH